MHIKFPLHFDYRGRTAEASDQEHLNDLMEELLLTNPGERCNRPGFGAGLLQLPFEPNSTEIASTLEFLIMAGLQQYLGDRIDVKQIQVTTLESTLQVNIGYIIRKTGQQVDATFPSKK